MELMLHTPFYETGSESIFQFRSIKHCGHCIFLIKCRESVVKSHLRHFENKKEAVNQLFMRFLPLFAICRMLYGNLTLKFF